MTVDDAYIARLAEASRVANISSRVRVRCMRAKNRLAKQRDAELQMFWSVWWRALATLWLLGATASVVVLVYVR